MALKSSYSFNIRQLAAIALLNLLGIVLDYLELLFYDLLLILNFQCIHFLVVDQICYFTLAVLRFSRRILHFVNRRFSSTDLVELRV